MTLLAADRVELHDLVCRYAAQVDDRRFAAAAALFTDEAVLAMPEPPGRLDPAVEHTGPLAIEAAFAALTEVPLTCHAVLGAVFDASAAPDTATGRITCVAHHLTRRGERTTDLAWHLRYRDRYARADGRWRFARRELHIDFIHTYDVRRSRIDDGGSS